MQKVDTLYVIDKEVIEFNWFDLIILSWPVIIGIIAALCLGVGIGWWLRPRIYDKVRVFIHEGVDLG